MKDTLNIQNIKRRLKSKKPIFWKKLQRLGVLFGAISASFLLYNFPDIITKIASYVGAISATVVLVAEFASEDKIDQPLK